ncbi:MAG TPA: hypothetical protein VN461_01530 [Vicinamibacteria bacterium]|nr:hypothetical protein [Vicinamibacteria bacterium]
MENVSKAPRDWFRWLVSLFLLVLAGTTIYDVRELRELREELKRRETPRMVPLADVGRR